MSLQCFCTAEHGFASHIYDWAKGASFPIRPTSVNVANLSGSTLWKLQSGLNTRATPNFDDPLDTPAKILVGSEFQFIGLAGTDRVFYTWVGGTLRIGIGGNSETSAPIEVWDSAWTSIVASSNLTWGTNTKYAIWVELTTTQIRVLRGDAALGNAVFVTNIAEVIPWTNHNQTLGTFALSSFWMEADVRVAAGKGAYEFYADSCLWMDSNGDKFNQVPTTHPKTVVLLASGDNASHDNWTSPASNKYQNIDDCGSPDGAVVSTNTAESYQIFDFRNTNEATALVGGACTVTGNLNNVTFNPLLTIDAVQVAGSVATGAGVAGKGFHAALEGGTLYDGPEIRGAPLSAGTYQITDQWVLEKTPAGLDWTLARLDGLAFGAKSLGAAEPNPKGRIGDAYICKVLYGGVGLDAPPPAAGAVGPPVAAQVI